LGAAHKFRLGATYGPGPPVGQP